MKTISNSLVMVIKSASKVVCLSILLIVCGCSHLHTYSFEANKNEIINPPIDLSVFFINNGLRKVSHEDGLYQMFAQREGKELIEIWFSEGTRIFEYWNDENYEVIVEPWGNGLEASQIAKNLSQWLIDNPCNTAVKYDKAPIFQWQ